VARALAIDPTQPIPLYFQLKTLLLEEILEGRYPPESRLPTEHELCERFGISRTPVTRALSELAEEGVVLRQRRRGTFVNPHWLRRPIDRPELRIVAPEGPWGTMVRDAAAEHFQVNLLTVPRPSLRQVLTHAVAEGQAPDLAVLDSAWIPEFAAAGFLRAIESIDHDWVRDSYERDFLPPIVTANRYQGSTFGVSAFGDVAGLWYRRDTFDRLGLTAPETWTELRAAARSLARDGVSRPIVMPAGSQGWETTAYCLTAFLASNGARVLDAEGVILDSVATTQALRFLRTLVDDGLMPVEVVGYEWNRSTAMLAEKGAAISFGGSYEAAALAEAFGVPLLELWDHAGFVPIPAGPRGAPAGVAGTMTFGIFSQTDQPRTAMDLLKHVVEPSVLAGIARSTGRIPARRSAVRIAAQGFPFLSQTAEMLERAAARPATPSYARVSAQLQAMLEAVLTGRLGPAAAARRTAEMIGAITGLPVVHEAGDPRANGRARSLPKGDVSRGPATPRTARGSAAR
jgi:ABC-type glycerol-3-phosphate transport system substrate-binding protein/DNA-binding transcriptional regulator YhcF (GntR family)